MAERNKLNGRIAAQIVSMLPEDTSEAIGILNEAYKILDLTDNEDDPDAKPAVRLVFPRQLTMAAKTD